MFDCVYVVSFSSCLQVATSQEIVDCMLCSCRPLPECDDDKDTKMLQKCYAFKVMKKIMFFTGDVL